MFTYTNVGSRADECIAELKIGRRSLFDTQCRGYKETF